MSINDLIKRLRKAADSLDALLDSSPIENEEAMLKLFSEGYNNMAEKKAKIALSNPGYIDEQGLGKTIQSLNMLKIPRVNKKKFIRKYTLKGKHWTQTRKGRAILSKSMKKAWAKRNEDKKTKAN